MEMAVQPVAGRVEAAFSRTSGIPVSGYGTVATVDFIVEEDIQGIRAEDEILPMEFHLEGIKVTGIGGETFTLPPFTKTIYLDLRKDEQPKQVLDVVLYPNPANDQIFIHSNRGIDISKVQILALDGSILQSRDIDFTTARIDVTGLQQGLYIARVETDQGISFKKFFVE